MAVLHLNSYLFFRLYSVILVFMKKEFETNSAEETRQLGMNIAKNALPGDVYTLTGDLGVGKTVFAKGFACGIGVEDDITSPTFTIVCEYDSGRIPLYHFDVYRIADPGEMDEIGFDDYIYGDGACLIEWAELIEDILPAKRISIVIEKDMEKGFDYRKITVEEMS